MADFPAYAKISRDGYTENPDSAVVRTDMEDGMSKQLKTKSRVLVKRPVKIEFESLADFVNFKTWFNDEIDKGALWFNWTDPVDQVDKLARIVQGTFSGAPQTASFALVEVQLQIETWDG